MLTENILAHHGQVDEGLIAKVAISEILTKFEAKQSNAPQQMFMQFGGSACVLRALKPKESFEYKLTLTKDREQEMATIGAGTNFDWPPNNQNYFSHMDSIPEEQKKLADSVKNLIETQ